jgi:ABC-type multidrug transport system ATPase subunit
MTDLSEARILATLELVGLGDRAKDLVKTYSDGMKQRLGIAQALMHHPELLILDEPFNSLDPQGVKDIRDLIVKLNKEQGTTVLVSSHKLDEIEKVATRMVMISNGQSIAEGRVQDLISERVAAIKFIVESPSEAKRILEASDIECSNIEIDEKYLTVFSNKDNIPRLVEALVSGKIKIYSVSDNHSLEELFLSLTSSL